MSNLSEMIPEPEKTSISTQAPSKLYYVSKIVKWVAILIVAMLITIIIFHLTDSSQKAATTVSAPTAQITVTTISTRISGASDLITAKMSYNGLIESQDGVIPVITKKSFLMAFHATVSVGYNLSNASINVGDHSVLIKMPALNDPDINVDTDSIRFYDLSSALFNWTTKEDGIDAVSVAKQKILESSELEELKVESQKQAEFVIHQLLDDNIGERDLNVTFE